MNELDIFFFVSLFKVFMIWNICYEFNIMKYKYVKQGEAKLLLLKITNIGYYLKISFYCKFGCPFEIKRTNFIQLTEISRKIIY